MDLSHTCLVMSSICTILTVLSYYLRKQKEISFFGAMAIMNMLAAGL